MVEKNNLDSISHIFFQLGNDWKENPQKILF